MKLWICVVGGEDSDKFDDERVIAEGGFEEMDAGVDAYAEEIYEDSDKYFWFDYDHGEFTAWSADEYYDEVRDEIAKEFSLGRILGRMLLPQR